MYPILDGARNDVWIGKFPKSLQELGYDSLAGTYELKDDRLILKPDITLNPLANRPRLFRWIVRGTNLTLTEELRPYTEDLRDGEVVTVLERATPAKNK